MASSNSDGKSHPGGGSHDLAVIDRLSPFSALLHALSRLETDASHYSVLKPQDRGKNAAIVTSASPRSLLHHSCSSLLVSKTSY